MTTKVVPGQLVAKVDAEQVAIEAASRIAKVLRDAIAVAGKATIGLSGGNTPRAAYALLAKEAIEWGKLHVFWIDERAVAPTDDRSNYRWAKVELLDRAPIPAANVHRMPGEATDLDEAARAYEAVLRATARVVDGLPALDVAVLGIGDDGHTASMFPGEATVEITDRLVVAVPASLPKHEARLTLTTPAIENARAAFILAVGKAKYEPLERVWSVGGSVKETPARITRGIRGSVTWVIDKHAGGIA